jgi:lantibiotic biosynthesis dehydratase-like protein
MEYWIEINLNAEVASQDGILLDVLRPYVRRLERKGELLSFHYFREPEIRFRVRLKSGRTQLREKKNLTRIAESLVKKRLVSEWHFGNHGEKGVAYSGEEDRYGVNGWSVAQDYFRDGSETALRLLELKRHSRLESPLWARGLGNPWEGGGRNPWREREEDPLVYHWSRYVHLFSNQLGFNMEREADLCQKQSKRYRQVTKEFGLMW